MPRIWIQALVPLFGGCQVWSTSLLVDNSLGLILFSSELSTFFDSTNSLLAGGSEFEVARMPVLSPSKELCTEGPVMGVAFSKVEDWVFCSISIQRLSLLRNSGGLVQWRMLFSVMVESAVCLLESMPPAPSLNDLRGCSQSGP